MTPKCPDCKRDQDDCVCVDPQERIEELERFIKHQDALLQGLRPIIVAASEVRKERDALQADNARLREALEQHLDDMGEEGHCVCEAAKQQAIEALAATGEKHGA